MKAILENGQLKSVEDSRKSAYSFPNSKNFFSLASSMVPMLSSVHPSRLLLADKGILQAIPLVNRETNLVRPTAGNKTLSYDRILGREYLSVKSDKSGKVEYIDDDEIKVAGKTFYLAQHFPMGRKSFLHQTPIVKVGDTVKSGDVIATSNYTDKKGNAALGVNLTTAIMPYRGYSFEDAYVVSEAGAKKLLAEQLILLKMMKEHGVEVNKDKHVSLFSNKYLNTQLSNIDQSGVAKRGTKLKYGDPVILAIAPKSLKTTDLNLGKLSKAFKNAYKDVSVTWDYDAAGTVVDVTNTGNLVQVTVKTTRSLRVGDKLSTLGFKGVIGKILSDAETPTLPDGKPIDLLLNPMAITSRVAPAVGNIMAVGKVAQKLNKNFKVSGFYSGSSVNAANKLLTQHGMTGSDDVYDPVSGQHVNVFTGPLYMHRLVHIAEDKTSESGDDAGVSFDQQPSKNDESSPKKVGGLMTTALLSHGATANLQDVSVRSTKSDDFWRKLKLGQPIPKPETPFIFNKFLASLQGAGVNVKNTNGNFSFMPLTNKDVMTLSAGAIDSAATFKVLKDNRIDPEKGGLFDPVSVGLLGDKFNHIELAFKIPNPISEDYLRRLLGMTESQLRNAIVSGELERKLNTYDVKSKMAELTKYVRTGKKTERDNALKVLKFLKNLNNNGLHPRDLLLDKIPVIPAQYRPIAVAGDLVLSSDVNALYRDVILTNNSLKSVLDESNEKRSEEGFIKLSALLPEDTMRASKLSLYDSVKAVYGFGDPVTRKSQEKDLKGLLGTMLGVRGGSAKSSKFQANIIGKPTQSVGRGNVIPDPTLDLDQIGLPQHTVHKLFTPFTVRRLTQKGIGAVDAMRMVKNKHPLAMHEMSEELKVRPGILTRDPQLWKASVSGAFIRANIDPLDSNIHVPPLITKGLGMDFDGDSANVHIPITEEASNEVLTKMMPSLNPFNVKTFGPIQVPSNESALGLSILSSAFSNKKSKKYKTTADVERDYLSGKLSIDDNVEIG